VLELSTVHFLNQGTNVLSKLITAMGNEQDLALLLTEFVLFTNMATAVFFSFLLSGLG
jgi:hypothetical protein